MKAAHSSDSSKPHFSRQSSIHAEIKQILLVRLKEYRDKNHARTQACTALIQALEGNASAINEMQKFLLILRKGSLGELIRQTIKENSKEPSQKDASVRKLIKSLNSRPDQDLSLLLRQKLKDYSEKKSRQTIATICLSRALEGNSESVEKLKKFLPQLQNGKLGTLIRRTLQEYGDEEKASVSRFVNKLEARSLQGSSSTKLKDKEPDLNTAFKGSKSFFTQEDLASFNALGNLDATPAKSR